MTIDHNGRKVLLRAPSKNDLSELVAHFSSMKIHMFTNGLFAQTLENETEWFEKNRKDPDSCLWLIQPDGYDLPVGVTGLHGLVNLGNSSSSGIIIWDPEWWGKGIASSAHIGRTFFAANFLNRFSIHSSVRTANNASRRALERVGYTVWGEEPCDDFRDGKWLSTYHLIWIRPDMANFLFNGDIPERYIPGIEKSKNALEIAKTEVVFL